MGNFSKLMKDKLVLKEAAVTVANSLPDIRDTATDYCAPREGIIDNQITAEIESLVLLGKYDEASKLVDQLNTNGFYGTANFNILMNMVRNVSKYINDSNTIYYTGMTDWADLKTITKTEVGKISVINKKDGDNASSEQHSSDSKETQKKLIDGLEKMIGDIEKLLKK